MRSRFMLLSMHTWLFILSLSIALFVSFSHPLGHVCFFPSSFCLIVSSLPLCDCLVHSSLLVLLFSFFLSLVLLGSSFFFHGFVYFPSFLFLVRLFPPLVPLIEKANDFLKRTLVDQVTVKIQVVSRGKGGLSKSKLPKRTKKMRRQVDSDVRSVQSATNVGNSTYFQVFSPKID